MATDARIAVAVFTVRDFLRAHAPPWRGLLVAFDASAERALRGALGLM
jgi:hypothetical protein